MTTGHQQYMSQHRKAPTVDRNQAHAYAAELFGVTGTVRSLPSYMDKNFLITTDNDQRWVLRIANTSESAAVLDLQNEAMTHVHIAEPGISPKVRKTRSGDSVGTIVIDGVSHMVRMVSFLDGTLFADAIHINNDTWKSLGQ